MKESTLAKITASVAVAKGMAQKSLAASPNPQWTEYELQWSRSGSHVKGTAQPSADWSSSG
jgi:hypothetical protein